MTVPTTTYTTGWLVVPLVATASTTGGAIASVANPEGVDLIVVQAVLYSTVTASGGCNVTVGIGATATTDATDIINALAINGLSCPIAHNGNVLDAKTALPAIWTTTTFLNVTGSGSSAAYVGKLYVQYIRTS